MDVFKADGFFCRRRCVAAPPSGKIWAFRITGFTLPPQLFLDQSRRLRIFSFTLFYVAQGIPIGLLSVALPGFMVAQGVEAADIATFIAVTGLPWGFKLVAGPFMDRFSFLPMGYRRPWVMAAQGGLALAVLALTTVGEISTQFALLVSLGFVVNCFGALQDVAVDGMAIDVLPEAERGRANAFMAFGQVAGFSVFGALNGWLLVAYGLPVTALISACIIALIFGFVAAVRERAGERFLPWTSGQSTTRTIPPATSFAAIAKDLTRVLFLPMSLILTAAQFVSQMGAGVILTIAPVMAVQELGYTAEQYAFWISMASAIGAFVGILFGPLVDRHGARKLLFLGFSGTALAVVTLAMAQSLWSSHTFILALLLMAQIAGQIVFVAVIAGFMTLCWTKVAATQFAIYMSLANLAKSVGAGLYGLVAAQLTSIDALYLVAGLNVLAFLLVWVFDQADHSARINALNAETIAVHRPVSSD